MISFAPVCISFGSKQHSIELSISGNKHAYITGP